MRRRASAYALYVLAKAGRGDLARLRWWHDVQMKTEASPLAAAQVGAGLALMGDQRPRPRRASSRRSHALGYQRRRTTGTRARCATWPAVIALAYEAGEPDIARSLQGRLDGAVQRSRQPEHPGAGAAAAGRPRHAEGRRADHASQASGASPRCRRPAARRAGRSAGWPTPASSTRRPGALWRTVTVRGTPIASPPAREPGPDGRQAASSPCRRRRSTSAAAEAGRPGDRAASPARSQPGPHHVAGGRRRPAGRLRDRDRARAPTTPTERARSSSSAS